MNIFYKKTNKNKLPNLVPLINIVFLLLIFFMLSGTLAKTDLFEVNPPKSNTSSSAEAPELVILISDDSKIALDNQPIKIKDLEEHHNLLRQYKDH